MNSTNKHEFDAPEPTYLRKPSVHSIAENVAAQLKFEPGGDIQSLVEGMGGKIKIKDFWSEGDKEGGSLEVYEEDNFRIYIPSDTSPTRDNFTIAHELGHYVLHYLWQIQVKKKKPFKLRATRYGSDRAEWEANWFASAFLMPQKEFSRQAKTTNLAELAQMFSVSRQAASIRAKSLGIDVD